MRVELSPHSHLEHYRAWLDTASASTLWRSLLAEFDFEQHSVSLFGKRVPQPRLIAWCGPRPYSYSGLTLPPRSVPDCLIEVLSRVVSVASAPFNHLLLNLYRIGLDSMGYHADNEPELGDDPVVATLSLGATRRFSVKSRRGNQTSSYEMANGDLLIMAGRCQREFVHGVPKQPRITEPRLSLTFRHVLERRVLERSGRQP